MKQTTIQRAVKLMGDLAELKGESQIIEIMTTGFRGKLADTADYAKNLANELVAIFEEVPEFKEFILKQRQS